jgi:hypothetical protein
MHPRIYCNHYLETEATDAPEDHRQIADSYEHDSFPSDEFGVSDFLRRLKRDGGEQGKDFAGNVGAYSALVLRDKMIECRPDEIPPIANILRYPVDWVMSGAYQTMNIAIHSPDHQEDLDGIRIGYPRRFKEIVPSNPTLLDKAFCRMCGELSDLAEEAELPWGNNFRMEDVTSNGTEFARMVKHLTGLDVSRDEEYLSRVFGRGVVHRHNPGQVKYPQDQLPLWQPWQRRVFLVEMQEHGLIPIYTQLGYDMSHLTRAITELNRKVRV